MATDELAGFLSAIQEPEQRPLTDYEMRYALALDELRKRQEARSEVPSVARPSPDQQTQAIRDMYTRQYVEGMQPRSDTSQRFPPQPKSYADKLADATRKAYGALSSVSPTMRAAESMRPAAEVAATLGTGALAFPAAALYGVGRAGTEAARQKLGYAPSPDVNKDIVADAINAMTYEPKTESAQGALGAIAQGFEASKMPHLWPLTPGRPLMTPEAMQVAGARTGMRLGEVKDIPADIRMQQQGLTRRNIMDEPTIGAQLGKGIAATAEAFPQNRQDLGLLLESQSGAVRPAGTRIVQPQFPPETNRSVAKLAEGYGQDTAMEMLRAFKNDMNYAYTLPHLRFPGAEGQAWAGAYTPTRGITSLIPHDVSLALEQAWVQHWRNYQKSLFPEFDRTDRSGTVEEAFKARFNTDEAYNSVRNQQLDEFLKTNEAKEIIGDHYVATPAEYMKKLDAFDNWVENKVVKNFISSKLGTPDDPIIKLTAEGKGFRRETGQPAFGQPQALSPSYVKAINEKRAEAGFPAKETPTFLKAEEVRNELSDLNIFLDTVREEKAAAFQEAVELYGLERHAEHAPFAAASQEENRLNRKIKRAEEQYNNLMQAISYENAADNAIEFSYNLPPNEQNSFLSNIRQIDRQFFEHTKRAPSTEKLYSYAPNGALQIAIERTITEIGKKFLKNEITEKQLQNLDFPKAVAQVSETLGNKLKLEEERRQTYRDRLSEQGKKDALAFQKSPEPDGTRVIVIDNQNFTPTEIDRLMSMDTAVLNHCMNNKGSTDREIHAFTGEQGSHYIPYADPVTGEVTAGARRQQPGYFNGIENGTQIIASFRDGRTGLPYASMQFRVLDNGLWSIHQFVGPGNGEIVDSAKRARDIASFLNANEHNITTNYDTAHLIANTNANVVDTLHEQSSFQIAQALGIPSNEVVKYDFYDANRRFLTKPELREMYDKLRQGAPATAKLTPSLVNPSQQWEYTINQGVHDLAHELGRARVDNRIAEEATTAYSALMHSGYINVVNDLFARAPDAHVNAINVGLENLYTELSFLVNAVRPDEDNPVARSAINLMLDVINEGRSSPVTQFLQDNRQLNGILVQGTPSFSETLDWFFHNVINSPDFYKTVDEIAMSTLEGLSHAGLTLESFYPSVEGNEVRRVVQQLLTEHLESDNPEYRHRVQLGLENVVNNNNAQQGSIPNLIYGLLEEGVDYLPLYERTAFAYAASELVRYLQAAFFHTDFNGRTLRQTYTPTIDTYINDPANVGALHNREVAMPQRFAQARAQQAPVQVVDMDIPEEPLVDDQGQLLADFEPEPEVQMPEGPGIVIRGRNEQPIPPLIGPEANAQPVPQPQVQPLAPVPVEILNMDINELIRRPDIRQFDDVAAAFVALRDQNRNDPVALNALPDIIAQYAIGPWAQLNDVQRALLRRFIEEFIQEQNEVAQRRLERLGNNDEDNDIPFAQGGLVERPLTIDDMKYALMMRSA